jgi:rhodanese-related sulfurtransferase
MNAIGPAAAKALIHGGAEIAFLDVREHGQYGEGHPLFVANCPFSRLELLAPRLAPRRTVPVLLIDGGDGVAARAAKRLLELGYADVSWIDGGAPAWASAGFGIFKGVNVPCKVLGELVEEAWHVPTLGPEELAAWRSQGRRFRFFDSRPRTEWAKMTVPGTQCLPNGELAHRFDAVIPDETEPLVLTCAGRTRGLIGAAGLKLAGIANPVYALRNGTQGWALAGFELLRGSQAGGLPSLGPAHLEASRARGRRLAEAESVPWLDAARFQALASDPTRTLFLLDVRSDEEIAVGSMPGAVHAPGGQLVQATDHWVGVRRARLVLVDDTGLRGTLAACWLRMLGFEVYVLPDLGRGSAGPVPSPTPRIEVPEVTLRDASVVPSAGGALLDLRRSTDYRAGHLPGARWAIRPRLQEATGAAQTVVLTGDDGAVAGAARDLEEAGIRRISRLRGGPAEWLAAGAELEATPDSPSDAEAIDFLFFVHDRHDGNLDAARAYIAWETGLVAQLDAAERDEFRVAGSLPRGA